MKGKWHHRVPSDVNLAGLSKANGPKGKNRVTYRLKTAPQEGSTAVIWDHVGSWVWPQQDLNIRGEQDSFHILCWTNEEPLPALLAKRY